MNLILMIPKLKYSGAPKMLIWLATKLKQCGNDVSILTFYGDNQEYSREYGIDIYDINQRQGSRLYRNTFGMISLIKKIKNYLKVQNPDYIISFLDSISYFFLFFNKLSKKKYKIIVSERADPYNYKKSSKCIRKKLISFSNGIVFQTEGAQSFFSKKIKKKSTVIPNPVTIKELKNIEKYRCKYEERENYIVSVGRLSLKQKRQDLLIDAFEKVLQNNVGIKLIIYGDGEDYDSIKSIIEKKNLTNSIILAGVSTNIPNDIYKAKCFVLSSDFEGIPNALIEAMYLGVPSISTDCSPGGARLLIKDSINGYIVPRGDINSLATKIDFLINNENICNMFSSNSITIVDDFSEEKIFKMWVNYIESIK